MNQVRTAWVQHKFGRWCGVKTSQNPCRANKSYRVMHTSLPDFLNLSSEVRSHISSTLVCTIANITERSIAMTRHTDQLNGPEGQSNEHVMHRSQYIKIWAANII